MNQEPLERQPEESHEEWKARIERMTEERTPEQEMSDLHTLLQFINMDDLPAKVESDKMLTVSFPKDTVVTKIHQRYPKPDKKREGKRIASWKKKAERVVLRWAERNGIRDKTIAYLTHHRIPEDYPTHIRINVYLMAVEEVQIQVPPVEHEWWFDAKDRYLRHLLRHITPEKES